MAAAWTSGHISNPNANRSQEKKFSGAYLVLFGLFYWDHQSRLKAAGGWRHALPGTCFLEQKVECQFIIWHSLGLGVGRVDQMETFSVQRTLGASLQQGHVSGSFFVNALKKKRVKIHFLARLQNIIPSKLGGCNNQLKKIKESKKQTPVWKR